MSVLIIEEKPPHFTDVEFEYKGIEFKAQICLLDTGKVMISFRVPKNELEQNLCKGLLNSRGTKLDIKINHLPMCANVDTCSFAILKGSSLFSDFSITVENNLILREDISDLKFVIFPLAEKGYARISSNADTGVFKKVNFYNITHHLSK